MNFKIINKMKWNKGVERIKNRRKEGKKEGIWERRKEIEGKKKETKKS